MSFSSEVKNELARTEPEKKCCQLAEIAGFLRVSGSLRLAGGGKFRIVISTDNPAIARHYKRLIKGYFGVDPRLELGEANAIGKSRSYLLTIGPEDHSDEILRETGILLVREGHNYLSDGIYDDIIRNKCCRKNYLKGVFLGAGSVADPDRTYHLELVLDTQTLANDMRKLINTFVDLTAKVTERKGKQIVYMKNSAYIRDTLAIMGAHSHVLELDNTLIKKQMINDAVRITNCDNANTDRTLDASEKQIRAIRSLQESGRYDKMPYKLREIAKLRLENPEASLTQLGEMMDPPLKKSGVNNRIKKILEMAGETSS